MKNGADMIQNITRKLNINGSYIGQKLHKEKVNVNVKDVAQKKAKMFRKIAQKLHIKCHENVTNRMKIGTKMLQNRTTK